MAARIAVVAPASVIHTVRWVNAFAERGYDMRLFTLHPSTRPGEYRDTVRVVELPFGAPLGYLLGARSLRQELRAWAPDLVHAHYASGYGTLAASTGAGPLLLSVWGSDVFDFPTTSVLHRRLVRRNLRAADLVASTSHVMAEQTRSLAPDLGEIPVTPFGVDLGRFSPCSREGTEAAGGRVVVGTVKTLKSKYGIDLLIRAFAEARRTLKAEDPELASRMRLRITGGGPERGSLEALAAEVDVSEVTTFVGAVPHDAVPSELCRLDVYVALSRLASESFGVAIIEASACGLPVVVADIGGLPEVVEAGVTGMVVPPEDVSAAARAIAGLVRSPEERSRLGAAGRSLVTSHFAWDHSVDLMEEVYASLLAPADKN